MLDGYDPFNGLYLPHRVRVFPYFDDDFHATEGSTVSDDQSAASINISRDPRFSALLNWVWGIMGLAVIAIAGWIGVSINNLNTNMALVLDRMEQKKDLDAQQSAELLQLRRDLTALEGRTFRGVSGYDTSKGKP